MSQLVPSAVSLRIDETEQLYQAKRMIGGIGDVLLSTYSQTESGKDPRVSLVDLWGQVMTPRGQILVSRTDDDPLPCVMLRLVLRLVCVWCAVCVVWCGALKNRRVSIHNASVCTFKTSP